MKILLDPQIFSSQAFGGISRYFTELYRFIKKDKRHSITCPFIYTENLHIEHYNLQPDFFRFLLKVKGAHRFLKTNQLHEQNRIRTLNALKSGKYDLFLPTYYDPYFLEAIGDTPYILTVYDMIHEIFPQYFPSDKAPVWKKKLIENSSRIIAISENTKRDILQFYPEISSDKIEVVYLSHSIDKNRSIPVQGLDGLKYILFVGNRNAYKNFDAFLRCVAPWLIKNKIMLLSLGGNAFSEEEQILLNNYEVSEFVRQYNFKDEELAAYYKNALAFVFPSVYEGFGIPVLEAMTCGCPVILPYTSSFPEVAGEAGIYYKVEDITTIIDCLNKLLHDTTYRDKKIAAGLLQEKKFSWRQTADACVRVFEKTVLGKGLKSTDEKILK